MNPKFPVGHRIKLYPYKNTKAKPVLGTVISYREWEAGVKAERPHFSCSSSLVWKDILLRIDEKWYGSFYWRADPEDVASLPSKNYSGQLRFPFWRRIDEL